ncbi:MAG: class I SAM-dependent methyltransferase [Candidatus Omnitrophica bacterium]|nr:class I SAM-dependent methyltransferase [Candidatus Omnitrophota bacterium]
MDFDNFGDNYKETLKRSLGFFGGREAFFDSYKIDYIKDWLVKHDGVYDILDFGCGIGAMAALLAKALSKSTVYGHDISNASLAVARKSNAQLKNVHFIDCLPENQKFDFIMAFGVFHHIRPEDRVTTLCRLKNLLKPGGKIIVFEHNPLNPLTRHIISKCPFDSDAELIHQFHFVEIARKTGLKVERKAYVLLFPWASKVFRKIEELLSHVPFGAQYMLLLNDQ